MNYLQELRVGQRRVGIPSRVLVIVVLLLAFGCAEEAPDIPTPQSHLDLSNSTNTLELLQEHELRSHGLYKNLVIRGSDISDDGLQHIGRMKWLISLNLSDTDITDDGLRHLVGLTQLRSLSLNGTGISDNGIRQIAALRQLRSLSLQGTAITDDSAPNMLAFRNLEALNISMTEMTRNGISKLLQLPKLRKIEVPLSITTNDIDALQQQFSTITIHR